MEDLELSGLKCPAMRKELIDYLQGLADKDYQYKAWVNDQRPGGGHDELNYAIHFLYDDTNLAGDPRSTLGWFLKNDEEVVSISDLVKKIDFVFGKYGLELTDKEYIEKPEWDDVVQAAKTALRTM
ncbi:CdiI immunity protein domain-containing protein [Bordetella tumbae]|uniref:SCO4402 family protein n=1 Tax=Bordetella tumbae TaxID=1649139 RepID=UPI0039EF878A